MWPHSPADHLRLILILAFLYLLICAPVSDRSIVHAQPIPSISFQEESGHVEIAINKKPFATYTFADKKATRPFFANVYSGSGIKVTRNYPAQAGDPKDHPHHQGIFFTFGDLNGIDYWHTRGQVVHKRFVQKPQGGKGIGSFAVENHYLSTDQKAIVCREQCKYGIRVTGLGILLKFDIKLTANTKVRIGSKEEGGIAIRVATPLNVNKGGAMIDNEGRSGGKQIWGKKAAWVDYSGKISGKHVGVTVLVHPKNPRPSWWHARDYGLLAANPFGPLNKKEGGMSLSEGESIRLRFAVLVHSHELPADYDPEKAFRDYTDSRLSGK